MTNIIKGNFGPKPAPEPGPYAKKPNATAGNLAPADPKLPSPPTYLDVDMAEPGGDQSVGQLIDTATGEPVHLTHDQNKAMGLILSGMPFVFVGIKETGRVADFFTALHGEPTVLRNAQDELPAAIARLYAKKGVTS